MIDEEPIKTARRLTRREYQGRCLICGRAMRLEKHHVAGRNHDPDFTAQICPACHALATENLRRADVNMRRSEDSAERVRQSLKATAVFLQMLIDALLRWAESLKP